METSFLYDLADKQLCFKLREKLNTRYNIEAKAKGNFNTVDGKLHYRLHAKKLISSGTLLRDAGSTPITLGLGIACISGSKDPMLALSAQKKIAVLDGPNTLLSAKVEADLDAAGKSVRRQATVKLSHKLPAFNKKQDLKLTAGLDMDWPAGANRPTQNLLLQVKENNWALHLRRQRWSVTYDL